MIASTVDPVGAIQVRGSLTRDKRMDGLTWLRVGGPADWLFQPADAADLAAFLSALPADTGVLPVGVGSNLIVRDGGIDGVVVRLGRGFNGIRVGADGTVVAGAAALDSHVARRAAAAGVDLTFLRTIPGSLGGAVRMNAGCYGTYLADVFVASTGVNREGALVRLQASDVGFGYRSSALPDDLVITEVELRGPLGDPTDIEARMADQLARRSTTQPTESLSAGSTFRNPAGHSSTGAAGEDHSLKAWYLIEQAGLCGVTHGGAQMSSKHANFLVNAGKATAADLEELGEFVIKKVFERSGIELDWEIMRVGRKAVR